MGTENGARCPYADRLPGLGLGDHELPEAGLTPVGDHPHQLAGVTVEDVDVVGADMTPEREQGAEQGRRRGLRLGTSERLSGLHGDGAMGRASRVGDSMGVVFRLAAG